MDRNTILSRLALMSLILALVPGLIRTVSAQQSIESRAEGTQVSIVLDLELALRYALDQSWRMERVRLDLQRDRYNLEASRAGLKSNANMYITLPDFDQSLTEWIDSEGNPRVVKKRNARYSSSISIRQPLSTDGVVSLNGVMNRSQDKLFSYTPGLKNYYGKLFVRYEQPILQPNRIQMQIRQAELRLEGTELSFMEERIKLMNDISRDFFELYERTYDDILAAEEVARLEQVYRTGRQLFQRGGMSEIDLLQLEVDLSSRRERASSAAGRLVREKASFQQKIGLPMDEEIEIRTELTFTPVEIDAALAIERALRNRPDMRRNEMWREGQEMDLVERRSRGSINGTVSLILGLECRGSEMDRFYDALVNPDQARGVSINFRVPLWDWGRNRARVNAKLIELEKVRQSGEEVKRSIRREVQSVVDRVMEAQARLDLLVRSVDAANRSYRLSLQQFETGVMNSQDLLLTQHRLADSKRSYLNAYLDYRRALVDMMRRTYWDWELDQSLTATLETYVDNN
ncbi:MAG: TolC family protein [Candidatus Latescibacteria bacterium]|nr:TolC family protein [Candidatus Latescibacterota bacterium]